VSTRAKSFCRIFTCAFEPQSSKPYISSLHWITRKYMLPPPHLKHTRAMNLKKCEIIVSFENCAFMGVRRLIVLPHVSYCFFLPLLKDVGKKHETKCNDKGHPLYGDHCTILVSTRYGKSICIMCISHTWTREDNPIRPSWSVWSSQWSFSSFTIHNTCKCVCRL